MGGPVVTPKSVIENYKPDMATAMLAASQSHGGGLPEYLGITTTAVGPGTMTVSAVIRPELLNPFGSAHGGVLAAMVDHVLGAVLYPVIDAGAWAATTEFKLNFLRPVANGNLEVTATIVSLGRRTAVVQIEAINDATLVGVAQGTVTITRPK